MEIFLVNPDLSKKSATCINLGLGYITSSLIKEGYPVTLIDLSFVKNYQRYIFNKVNSKLNREPLIFGFSVMDENFLEAIHVAKIIKNRYPEAIILFGGIHATLFPEEVLSYPEINAICIGEGERSFVEYLNKLEKGEELIVDGIWYKDRSTIVRNKLRPYENNLDIIPFPAKGYFLMRYYLKLGPYLPGTIPYLASRGCPYKCTFCNNVALKEAVPGRYYRLRNAENIILEITSDLEKFGNIGFKNVGFVDATFGINKEQFDNFCYLFEKRRLSHKLTWSCETRADIITPQWVKQAARCGCILVNIGVESGNDYIRNEIYNKHLSKKQIFDAVKNLKKYNIMVAFDIIYGCPYDSEKTLQETVEFIEITKPTGVIFFPFIPYPKTEMGKNKFNHETFMEFLKKAHDCAHISSQVKKIVNKFAHRTTLKVLIYCIFNKNIVFFLDLLKELIYLLYFFPFRVIIKKGFLMRRTYLKYLYLSWNKNFSLTRKEAI